MGALVRGKLSESRAAVVRKAWQALDYTQRGFITTQELLVMFDARQLQCCRLGAMTPAQAQLQLLEGLGIEGWTTPEDLAGWAWGGEYCFNEFTEGRRAKPIGAPGKPLHAPAGKPTLQRASMRPVGDFGGSCRGSRGTSGM